MTIEELQAKLESLENGQVKKEDIEALKAEIAKMTPEVKKEDVEKLDKALNDLNAKMEKLDKGISKKMTFEESIKEVFERPEVKAAIEEATIKSDDDNNTCTWVVSATDDERVIFYNGAETKAETKFDFSKLKDNEVDLLYKQLSEEKLTRLINNL